MSNSVLINLIKILDNFTLSDYYGLKNQGATCYLNSVLQVLFMTKDFREAVERHCGQDSSAIDPHLIRLFKDLEKRTADTHHITKELGIVKIYEQRDAAEYFERILNMISPKASQMFKGQLRHTTTCCGCEKRSGAEGPFWTLPLSMEDNSSHAYSVRDGFEAYFKPSKVSGDNRLYCDRCNAKTDATIECEIGHHPEILTLLLKRFKFDCHKMHYVKNNSCVDVPKILQTEKDTYDLYALVNHFGSLRGGHVTATIKSYETGEWYNFNDTRVTMVKPPLFEASDNKTRSSNVYLLMYRKGSRIINGAFHEPHSEKPGAVGVEKEDVTESGEDHLSRHHHHHHLKDDSNYAKKSPKRICNKSKERRDDIKARKGHGGESIKRDLVEKQDPPGSEVAERAVLCEERLPHRDGVMAGVPDRQEKGLSLERHYHNASPGDDIDIQRTVREIRRRNDTSVKIPREANVAKPGQNNEELNDNDRQTDYQPSLLNGDICHQHWNENSIYSQVNMVTSKGIPTMAQQRQHENVANNEKMDSVARCLFHSTVTSENYDKPAGNHVKNEREGMPNPNPHAYKKQKSAISCHVPSVKPKNFERDQRNVGTGTSQGKGKNAEQKRVQEKKPWK